MESHSHAHVRRHILEQDVKMKVPNYLNICTNLYSLERELKKPYARKFISPLPISSFIKFIIIVYCRTHYSLDFSVTYAVTALCKY